mmetsp:Transcript_38730/g.80538  ORF Transcript_38730/g.80538 Transcript_38730/m.80538 type:complete len:133 (-) Transcript_38730:56-454(-)
MADIGCACVPYAHAEAGAVAAPVAVVAFVNRWFGPSQMAVRQLQATAPSLGVEVFFVDADQEAHRAHQLGIWAAPALLFFARGSQLTVQRPEADDANKYVGSISMDELDSLLRQARESLTSGNAVLCAGAHK